MLLTAEAYEQFFKSLRVENGGVQREKRTTSRVHLRVRIEIIPIMGSVREEKLTVWTHNLSNHGISLTTNQPLIRDCQFLIELPRSRGKPLTLICTVKHSRALGPRQFRVGATQRVAREDEIPAPLCDAVGSERQGGYRSVMTRSAAQALRKPPPLQRLSPAPSTAQEVARIRKAMFD